MRPLKWVVLLIGAGGILAGCCHRAAGSSSEGDPAEQLRSELASCEERLQELKKRELQLDLELSTLEERYRSVPPVPPDGCADIRMRPKGVRMLQLFFPKDTPEGCDRTAGCRDSPLQVAHLDEPPSSCTGDVCRYVGRVRALLLGVGEAGETAIVYASGRCPAMVSGGGAVSELTGAIFDVASGTLSYRHGGSEEEYRFNEAPVVVLSACREEAGR